MSTEMGNKEEEFGKEEFKGSRSGSSNNKKDSGNRRRGSRGKGGRRPGGSKGGGIPNQSFNDFAWYNRHPELVKSTCSLTFSQPAGTTMWPVASLSKVASKFTYSPGIMAVRFLPTPGIGTDANSPLNEAAQLVYANMRKANSGSKNYDPVDLMMYILAVDSAASFVSMLQRAYGISMNWDVMNKYTPDALLRAMHIDPNIITDRPKFATLINLCIAKLNMYFVPNDIDLVKRHYWMNANIYRDDDNPKAQMFMYVQEGYYIYNELDGQLEYQNFVTSDGGYSTLEQLQALADKIFNALFNTNTTGLMSGDLQKAYSTGFTVPAMPLDYKVEPVKNDSVLTQIHNCWTAPFYAGDNLDVNIVLDRQNNLLIWDPTVNVPSNAIHPDLNVHILNSYSRDVGVEEVMEMTRMHPTYRTVLDQEGVPTQLKIESCGTEIPLFYTMWYYIQTDQDTKALSYASLGTYTQFSTFTNNIPDLLHRLGYFEMFDWHPSILVFDQPAQPNQYSELISMHSDLDNYTYIDSATIDRIHNVALYSLYGI